MRKLTVFGGVAPARRESHAPPFLFFDFEIVLVRNVLDRLIEEIDRVQDELHERSLRPQNHVEPVAFWLNMRVTTPLMTSTATISATPAKC